MFYNFLVIITCISVVTYRCKLSEINKCGYSVNQANKKGDDPPNLIIKPYGVKCADTPWYYAVLSMCNNILFFSKLQLSLVTDIFHVQMTI